MAACITSTRAGTPCCGACTTSTSPTLTEAWNRIHSPAGARPQQAPGDRGSRRHPAAPDPDDHRRHGARRDPADHREQRRRGRGRWASSIASGLAIRHAVHAVRGASRVSRGRGRPSRASDRRRGVEGSHAPAAASLPAAGPAGSFPCRPRSAMRTRLRRPFNMPHLQPAETGRARRLSPRFFGGHFTGPGPWYARVALSRTWTPPGRFQLASRARLFLAFIRASSAQATAKRWSCDRRAAGEASPNIRDDSPRFLRSRYLGRPARLKSSLHVVIAWRRIFSENSVSLFGIMLYGAAPATALLRARSWRNFR